MKKGLCLGGWMIVFLINTAAALGQQGDLKAQWVERIRNVQDHKVMAFKYGPELMKLDPQASLEIAMEAWPGISKQDVKTGVLKAFDFGRHPRVFTVLNLGITDSDPKIQQYALSYVRQLTLRPFDANDYKVWYEQNKNKTLDEVTRAAANDLAARLKPMDVASGMGMLDQVEFRGWLVDQRRHGGKIPAGERFFDILSTWYHDPKTPPKLLPQLLECMGNLRTDDQFIEKEILPLIENSSSDELCATAFHVYSESGRVSTGMLIRKLQEEYSKGRVWDIAQALAKTGDTHAIPAMIGVIDADNSYDTIYGVGYFGLGYGKMRDVTKVNYSEFHDGAWWRRWWAANKARFPKDVQDIPIPDLPKTENGKKHVPFPADMDTFEGRTAYLHQMIRSGKLRKPLGLSGIAGVYAEEGDPRAIPVLIGVIAADNSYGSIYGVGYFGLSKLTGVQYDPAHDGAWWKQWWAANKTKYPEAAQKLEIPDFTQDAMDGKVKAERSEGGVR